MLATLKRGRFTGLVDEESRFSFMIMPVPFRLAVSYGDGQGPEKPIIEEPEVEEEVFTFDYPEHRGDISHIVNPPVEGIAKSMLHAETKLMESHVSMRNPSDIFSYISFNPIVERPRIAAEPKLISLTRQPEIAGSYSNLLVYSTYEVSDPEFGYGSDEPYEGKPIAKERVYYREGKLPYENIFLMPVFSERIGYHGKANDNVYVRDTTEPKLEVYQDIKPIGSDTQSMIFKKDIPSYKGIQDMELKIDNKADYIAPEIQHPPIKSELSFLDSIVEVSKNEAFVLPMHGDSYKATGLITNLDENLNNAVINLPNYSLGSDPKLDIQLDHPTQELELPLTRNGFIALELNINTCKDFIPSQSYDSFPSVRNLAIQITPPKTSESAVPMDHGAKAEYDYGHGVDVEHKTSGNMINMPSNPGFDDNLLRDRIFSGLKELAAGFENRDTTPKNIDSYGVQEVYNQDLRINDGVRLPEVRVSIQDYSDINIADQLNTREDIARNIDIGRLPEAMQDNSCFENDSLLMVEDSMVLEYGSPDTPHIWVEQGKDLIEELKNVKGDSVVWEYSRIPDMAITTTTIVIPIETKIQEYTSGAYAPDLPNNLDVWVDEARNQTNIINVQYDGESSNISLGGFPNVYDGPMISLESYLLFDQGDIGLKKGYQTDNQTYYQTDNRIDYQTDNRIDYQTEIDARDTLSPDSGHTPRSDLVDIVKADYANSTMLEEEPILDTTNLYLDETGLQEDVEEEAMGEQDYHPVSSAQNIDEVVDQAADSIEEKLDIRDEAYKDNNMQEEVYETAQVPEKTYGKTGMEEKTETWEQSGSSPGYVAAAATGVVGLGLFGLISSLFGSSEDDSEPVSDIGQEYTQKDRKTKEERPEDDYNTKKCGYSSAKDSEKEIKSKDYADTAKIDGEESKKLCFEGIEEKEIDPESLAKTQNIIPDSDKEGTKRFCFREIKEGDNSYVNIDGVDYKSYSTLSVSKDYRQKIQDNPEKSIINIRGKDGGDLTSQYKVSNKSVIAALYAYAMDETENDGKGLTMDVRLDRNLERYELLDKGRLTVNGIFGLDDFDSQYIIQAVKRDDSGNIIERYFPRGEDGEFLSVDEELPDLYKDHDIELVRLESKGEKEWEKDEDVDLMLSIINEDSERLLKDGRYAPVLSQLTDESGNHIGRAYIVGDKIQITEKDVQLDVDYSVERERALDKDESPLDIKLKDNGLLAILDRNLQEQGMDAIYKTMPTQKNRVVLRENEVYMKDIAGLHEQLEKLHSYMPKERWSMLVVEEDPLTGELSEPGYDPEKGMQFTPELGKIYRILIGDGSDISGARIKTDVVDYQKEKISEIISEPIPV